MGTLLTLISAGFFLGMWHATDADHVVAVSTIVARERSVKGAARIGMMWGLGHTLTIAAVGGAIILFSLAIPKSLENAAEVGVGVMLILLGLLNLSGFSRWLRSGVGPAVPAQGLHAHIHSHGDFLHTHVHGHSVQGHGHDSNDTPLGWLDAKLSRFAPYQWVRPVVIGVVHGLAGSAAVALMVLAAVRDPWWGLAYLLLFGLGTIAGMMLITSALAAPLAFGMLRFPSFGTHLRMVSGLASVGFGIFLIVAISFGEGVLGQFARAAH